MGIPRLNLIGAGVGIGTLRLLQVEARQAASFTRHPAIIIVVIAQLPERTIVETERSELGIGIVAIGGGDGTGGQCLSMSVGIVSSRDPQTWVVSQQAFDSVAIMNCGMPDQRESEESLARRVPAQSA